MSIYKNEEDREAALARFRTIAKEVGMWSLRNFGLQVSKAPATCRETSLAPVVLNEIAPTIGMIEELGELADAMDAIYRVGSETDISNVESRIRDAVADIGIYFCDLLFRSQFDAFAITGSDPRRPVMIVEGRDRTPSTYKTESIINNIAGALGQIAHCFLKRHQAIRRMGDPAMFREKVTASFDWLYQSLDILCSQMPGSPSFVDVIEETWQSVKQRDWVKHRHDGGEGRIEPAAEVTASP